MAKIETLLNNSSEPIYPNTVAKAVFTEDNKNLQHVLNSTLRVSSTSGVDTDDIPENVDADTLDGHPASYYETATHAENARNVLNSNLTQGIIGDKKLVFHDDGSVTWTSIS